MKSLFKKELMVINIGLKSFKETLNKMQVPSIDVDFSPPLDVADKYMKIVLNNREKINNANQETIKKVLNSKPFLIGLEQAINVIPGMKKTSSGSRKRQTRFMIRSARKRQL